MDRFFKPWLPAKPPTYLFVNANVVDTVSGTITPGARVYVADGHIISVSTNEDEQLPEDAVRIDLEGQFLCPGLTDAHVHVTATPGEADLKNMINVDEQTILLRTTYVCRDMLSRGFTMARDVGGAPLALKEAIEDGLIPGPRLSIAGHVLSQTGGHGDLRSSYQHKCLHIARDELRRGSDFLKIMGSGGFISPTDAIEDVQFTPEEIRAITSVANAAGKYATSHAYTPQAILNAINNGVMGIEHGNLLDAPTAKVMAEKGVFLTPTLVTYATMVEGQFASFIPDALKAKNRSILDSGFAALKIAKEAGIVICFGSDLLGPMGALQSTEFSLRSKLLSPLEILQSATINPAKMMNLPKSGQIREGFWADLIVLKSNPLADITVLDRTETELMAVFKEGRPYYSKLTGVKGSLD